MNAEYTHWRKSQRSEPNGDCVAVAQAPDGTIGIRDTKAHLHSPILQLTPPDWAALHHSIKAGALDLPH